MVDIFIIAENAIERLILVIRTVCLHAYIDHPLTGPTTGAEGLNLCDSHHAV